MRRAIALLIVLLIGLAVWLVVSMGDEPATPAPTGDSTPAVASSEPAADDPVAPAAPAPGPSRDRARARPRTDAPAPPTTPPAPPPASPADPNALIRGVVKFADGRPVAGAAVRAWDASATYNAVAAPLGGEVVTGSDGRFELPGPDQDRQIVVYAKLAGFHTGGSVMKKGAGPAEITVILGEGGTLTGTVRDAGGAPLADRYVYLAPARRWEHHRGSQDWRFWSEPGVYQFFVARTTTDAKGRYEFRGVPLPRKTNEPRVAVAEDDEGRTWASDEVTFAAPGERIVRDVTIGASPFSGSVDPPGVARSVVVTVLDDADAPVRGAALRYAALSPEAIRWWAGRDLPAEPDTGVYLIEIPADKFVNPGDDLRISISAPGYETLIARPDRAAMTVTLRRSAGDAPWGRIAGRVVDGNGRAVPGVVEVQLVPLETFDAVSVGAVADADGAFVVEGLAPGDYLAGLEERLHWQELTIGGGGTTSALFRVEASAVPDADAGEDAGTQDDTGETGETGESQPESGADEAAKEVAAAEARLREILRRQATEELTDSQLRGHAEELRQLEETLSRAFRGRSRAVELTGAPSGAVIVAECNRTEWRAVVAGGVARFPLLPCGVWDFHLRGRTATDAVPRRLRVDPGTDTLRLSW